TLVDALAALDLVAGAGADLPLRLLFARLSDHGADRAARRAARRRILPRDARSSRPRQGALVCALALLARLLRRRADGRRDDRRRGFRAPRAQSRAARLHRGGGDLLSLL